MEKDPKRRVWVVEKCIRTGRITWTVICWPGLILVPAVGREMKLLCAMQPTRLRKMVKMAANFIMTAICRNKCGDYQSTASLQVGILYRELPHRMSFQISGSDGNRHLSPVTSDEHARHSDKVSVDFMRQR